MAVTIDNTVGAIFIEILFSSILFGIVLVQAYIYYLNFPDDALYQKCSVTSLVVLSGVLLIFDIYGVYNYIISNFGNFIGLETVSWSVKVQILFDTIIVCYVQGLYALRIWMLGRHFSRLWSFAVCTLVALAYLIGIDLLVEVFHMKFFTDLNNMHRVLYGSLSASTFLDIVMAISLFYFLWDSQLAFLGTNSKVLRISKYVLVCGFLTSACSLSTIVMLAIMPNNLIFLGFFFSLPKLYVNSYIALLNARCTIRANPAFGKPIPAPRRVMENV